MAMSLVTLVDLLRERVGSALPVGYRYLDKGEVAGPMTEWSWAELDRRARAIGARLQELGYSGERALLLFPPGLDFVAGFFGSLYAGTVAVPAYPPDPARLSRLQGIVRDARPAVVLTTAAVAEQLMALAARIPEIAVLETLAVDTCAAGWEDSWRAPAIDGATLAFLQYTSGSTGQPRGVRITHERLLANQRMLHSAFALPEASCVSWLPLFHDMGLIGTVLQPLYQDRPVTLMSPLAFVKRPMRWLRAISTLRAPISGGPDFAYGLCTRTVLAQDLEKIDLSCWKLAFSGAEPVRPETLEAFARTFAPAGFDPAAFYPTYGLAEATLFVTGGAPGRGARTLDCDVRPLEEGKVVPGSGRRLVDCGPAAPGTEIAILRADGSPAAAAEIGEITVCSPSVADGYWDAPRASEETFGFTSADGRRWLRSGDLGFLHEGRLFVTGRRKDVIIVRGRNHYPHDIERTVEEAHEAVRASGVAAFSIPTESGEGLGLAVEVALGTDGAVVETAVRSAVSAGHELAVAGLALIAPRSLPRTSSGKLQRQAARQAWLEDALPLVYRAGVDAPTPGGLPPWMVDWLQNEAKVERMRIRRDATFADLGLDSLAVVQLAAAMEERLGTEVPAEVLFGRALGEIAQWLETAAVPTAMIERPDLEAEARLDAAIVMTETGPHGDSIFLTGASGFLGSHLLAELLARSERPVICLVRSATPEVGLARILDTARRLEVALDPARIDVVTGDLATVRFGLSPPAFEALARRIWRIVHCGARVDWSASFAEIAPANVRGTHEVARLAAQGGGIPVHHVSSLGVLPIGLSRRDHFAEADGVSEGELLRVPYFQSKWAAERVLEHARELGVPVTVYRPGLVVLHSRTGAELAADQQLLCAFLCGSVRMGTAPAVEKVMDAVPVDFVAAAVAALALAHDTAGRTFNLLNPQPLQQSALYAMLRARGFRLTPTAYPRWREQVLALPRADAENPLARFALYYRTVTPGWMRRLETLLAERFPVDDAETRERLAEAGVACVPFDARLVDMLVDRYLATGLLPKPSVAIKATDSAHAPTLLELPELARPFLGDLPDTEKRLIRLYDNAKQRQWDASTRLDWSADLDPENPESLSDESIPLWGSPVWTAMTPQEKTRVRVHYQAWQLSQFLAGEQGALLCAGRVVQQAPSASARLYSATQVVDEARHVEIFSRLLHQKIGVAYTTSAPLQRLLDDVLYNRCWDVTCLGMQVLIEGLGLAVFSMVRNRTTHPLIATAHAYVVEDEARHVSFGRVMLEDLYRELSDSERAEREEFVVEASYLLRDRFAARDLWEQLGLPVSRCVGWVEESGYMRHYRNELFRRIVPVVRAIGLWGPRVREAYARMGVLEYGALEPERLVQEDEAFAREIEGMAAEGAAR
jgi:thioester reductase-like protein